MRSRCWCLGLWALMTWSLATGGLWGDETIAPDLAAPQTTDAPAASAEQVAVGAVQDSAVPAETSDVSTSTITSAPACAVPQNCSCVLRPQDQFWSIDTHHLPCVECQAIAAPQLCVSQYHCVSGWSNSTVADFVASAPGAITVFYVPGNRVAGETAVQRAWLIYQALAAAADEQPLRLVVWSWPSDKVRGLARDARVKASRTSTESLYLGWLASQLDPQAQVSFVGYSYGSRVISGALQTIASGHVDGSSLADFTSSAERKPARVVLMAAAMHNYWLLPGQMHESAITHVDQLLLLFNPCDSALRHYHRIEKCDRAQALGYTGFVGTGSLGDLGQKLRQLDVCCWIGKSHSEVCYYNTAPIIGLLRQYLLWGDL